MAEKQAASNRLQQQELRAHISTASSKQRKHTRSGREPFNLKAHAQWCISSSNTALFKSSLTVPPIGHQLPKYRVYEGHSYSKHPGSKSYSVGNQGNKSYNMGKPQSSVNGQLEEESQTSWSTSLNSFPSSPKEEICSLVAMKYCTLFRTQKVNKISSFHPSFPKSISLDCLLVIFVSSEQLHYEFFPGSFAELAQWS